MKLGKNHEVLINPNVRKFACLVAIVAGWFWWPKEEAYLQYEAKTGVKKESEIDV